MSEKLTGKVAVVTGAATGIGQAYALRLAADGADVALVDLAVAEETTRLIAKTGRRVEHFICDVSSEEQVSALGGQILQKFARIDILVNNAGIYPLQSFEDMTYADWRHVLTTDLDSMFLMCKAVVPLMKKSSYGRIVNISSAECWMVAANAVHYIAAKMGVIGLTRALATEVAEFGITVNAVAVGLTGTETVKRTAAEYTQAIPKMQAIKRLEMPEDLVGVVSFLSSDDSAFMTGQTLVVDGGLVRI